MNTAYRSQLRREVEGIQNRFGNYVRTPFETGILDDSSLSDKAAYFLTKLWRDNVDMAYRMSQQPAPAMGMSQQYNGRERKRHLVLSETGNGGYMLVDRSIGSVEAIIHPHKNSLDYIGTDSSIRLLGGQMGQFGKIIEMAEDKDVLHTKRHYQNAA